MAGSILECLTKFNQIILLIVNVFVALLGLAVMIVGAWAKGDSRQYFTIASDDSEYTQVSVLLIVVGLFVLIIGIVGAVGALFASKAFGRVILIIYAIGLGLLVVCEIAGGIAAAVARNTLENVFRDSANTTFQNYNNSDDTSERDTWNQFQKDFRCCGVENYTDYKSIFQNNSVPVSCCDPRGTNNGEEVNCTVITRDVYNNGNAIFLYQKGCADALIDAIDHNLGAIAGSAIFLALIQIVGIVMACFVAVFRKEKTYEVV
jgi:hypothetical protein